MLRQLGYSIIRFILLIRNYGFFTGLNIWRQIAFSLSTKISINSSLFRNPVTLRKHDSDLVIFDQVFAERQYKWFEIEKLEPKIIVDAGANIGLAALYFAYQFPQSRIYCVEPVSANYDLLQKNLNAYSNIEIIKGAVWYTDEYLEIENPEGFSAGLSMKSSSASTKIMGYSIPSLMSQFKLEHIDILKMDIEGAEKEIFESGNLEWLKKVSILVIELHDMYKAGTAKAFFQGIHNQFEKIYFQGENLICFLKKETEINQITGNRHS